MNEVWKAGENMHREINLCAEYLDRPMPEVCATMLHEMAHLYNLQHGIADVSNNGYYHNNTNHKLKPLILLVYSVILSKR